MRHSQQFCVMPGHSGGGHGRKGGRGGGGRLQWHQVHQLHALSEQLPRVARKPGRVFKVQTGSNPKHGENLCTKWLLYQMSTTIPNGRKIFQIAINYANVFHSKALHNVPKLGFLV
jgi:hypothetical protein